MISMLSKLKYRLSHITSKSWHWRASHFVWSEKSQGKACTHYWVKLPLALLALLVLVVLAFLYSVWRVLVVAFVWLIGFRYNEDILDFDWGVSDKYNYDAYKQRKDESYKRFAPWEYVVVLLVILTIGYFVFVNQALGIIILKYGLVLLASVAVLVALVYTLTAGWKDDRIVRARQNVSAAWHRVCPPLVVTYDEEDLIQ